MYLLSAKKKTADAISSSVPNLPSGIFDKSKSSSDEPSEGRRIAPGATPFTVTSGAKSLAKDLVSVSRQPFAEE